LVLGALPTSRAEFGNKREISVKRFSPLLALLATLCFLVPPVSSAQAQASRTWVSGVGDDVNPCSRTAPCKTFGGAYGSTLPGGEINCLDSGGFGSVTITDSITIACENVLAGVLASGTNGITVNAGPNDIVTLRGLEIDGGGTGNNGIKFIAGSALIVEKCVIRNFNTAAPNGSGILFAPASTGRLIVAGTYFSNNGSGTTGAGILISPAAGGSALVNIERSSFERNTFGIAVDGTNSTAGINTTIADSMLGSQKQDGIIATTPGGGAPIGVLVTNVKSVNNTFGIRSLGPNVTVRVESSIITGNVTGLAFGSGGALLTTGNNLVQANGANGAFSGPVALQ